MPDNYELTGEARISFRLKLRRIRATRQGVNPGDDGRDSSIKDLVQQIVWNKETK